MSGISFGQYYPARSLLHRLDPRIKIILTLLYIICSFMCKNIISYALLLFSAIILVIIGRVPIRIILKGLKGVLFILLFTAVLNIFWTTGDSLLWQWKFISIYAEGLYAALFIMLIHGNQNAECIFICKRYCSLPLQFCFQNRFKLVSFVRI